MDALWNESPLAASDVAERVGERQDWSATTVKTLLSRLAAKGAVKTKRDGRRFLYTPALSRNDYAKKAASSLADQLFGGRAAPLVAHLAEGRGLEEDDIQELEALIRELKNERN